MLRRPLSWSFALMLAVVSACDTRVWTGPLAAAGDSVTATAPTVGCDTVSGDGGFPFARVSPPVRSCEIVRGDTTFALLSDSDGKLLIVARSLAVDSARQMLVHDSIQFAVATDYEAPAICEFGADSTETEVRRWNTLDRQIVLMNVGSDEVRLELRVDHEPCR